MSLEIVIIRLKVIIMCLEIAIIRLKMVIMCLKIAIIRLKVVIMCLKIVIIRLKVVIIRFLYCKSCCFFWEISAYFVIITVKINYFIFLSIKKKVFSIWNSSYFNNKCLYINFGAILFYFNYLYAIIYIKFKAIFI